MLCYGINFDSFDHIWRVAIPSLSLLDWHGVLCYGINFDSFDHIWQIAIPLLSLLSAFGSLSFSVVLWITPVGLNQARTQSHSTVTLLGWTQAPSYHNNTSLYCSSAVIPCSHSLSWSLFYELATKYSCTVNCTYIALVQHGIQAGLFYHLYKSCRTLNEGIAKLNLSHYCFQEIGSNTLAHQWLLKQIIGTC